METSHDDWIEAGYCPDVNQFGEWCVLLPDHGGVHETPRLVDGRVRTYGWLRHTNPTASTSVT